ncbi:MAG TPA: hypothetical protein VIC62_18360, partial [Nakamurella sp.]
VNLAIIAGVAMAVGFGIEEPWGMVTLLAFLMPIIGCQQYRSIARQLAHPFGAGTSHWVLFGPTTVAIAGPMGVTESRYETFQHVWRTTGAVVLRIRRLRSVYVLPIELVPPHELARLHSMIERH